MRVYDPLSLDSSLTFIDTSVYIKRSGNELVFYDVCTGAKTLYGITNISGSGISQAYVDGSLLQKDISLNAIWIQLGYKDTSISAIDLRAINQNIITNASLGVLQDRALIFDASIGVLQATDLITNASLGVLEATDLITNASLGVLQDRALIFNVSIGVLEATDLITNASLGTLQTKDTNIDTSLNNIYIQLGYKDTSISAIDLRAINQNIITNASLGVLQASHLIFNASLGTLQATNLITNASLGVLQARDLIFNASIGNLDVSIKSIWTKLDFVDTSLNSLSGGTPSGGDGQIQYYNTGAFAADPSLLWLSNAGLGINVTNPSTYLDVGGTIRAIMQTATTMKGEGLEMFYTGGAGTVYSINRTLGTYRLLKLQGSNIQLLASSATTVAIDVSTTGVIINPGGTDVNTIIETDDNPNMIWVDGGNNLVGIGTNIPASVLDVSGVIRATSQLPAVTGGIGAEMSYGGNIAFLFGYDRDDGHYKGTELRGTTIKLQVASTDGVTIGSSAEFDISTGAFIFNDDGNDIDFRVESANEANILDINGGTDKIGFGIAPTIGRVHVDGSLYVAGTIQSTTDILADSQCIAGIGSATAPSFAFTANSSLGIYRSAAATMGFACGGVIKFSMNSVGDFDAIGDVIAYSTGVSDIRLKKNIEYINGKSALQLVQQLNGVEYNLIRNNAKHIGLIAQEVEKIIPDIVIEKTLISEDSSTLYKTIRYTEIIPYLIEAIKELKKEINELKNQINK